MNKFRIAIETNKLGRKTYCIEYDIDGSWHKAEGHRYYSYRECSDSMDEFIKSMLSDSIDNVTYVGYDYSHLKIKEDT